MLKKAIQKRQYISRIGTMKIKTQELGDAYIIKTQDGPVMLDHLHIYI